MVGELNHTVPMRQQPIYIEDWIGLQELDRNNKIHFKVCMCVYRRACTCVLFYENQHHDIVVTSSFHHHASSSFAPDYISDVNF